MTKRSAETEAVLEDTGAAEGAKGGEGAEGAEVTMGSSGEPRGMAIAVDAATKTFGTAKTAVITAVDGVSLRIPAGSTVALTGPSGSGKSTLLHLLGAIERPDGGTISVGDVEITAAGRGDLAAYRRSVGFVFQRFHLLPALTARDNVIAPLLAVSGRAKAGVGRATGLLADVGLAGRENALPSQLSGGQQQRVAIARALIGSPGLLLADEPTGNLDSATGTEIIELLVRLNAERGTTLVIATHDPAIAARCGRTVSMLDGRIVGDTDVDVDGDGHTDTAEDDPTATATPTDSAPGTAVDPVDGTTVS